MVVQNCDKNPNFDLIQNYYNYLDSLQDEEGGPYKRTAVGQFVPSPLSHIKTAFDYLIETNTIDTTKPFLDAGSGDGRIVAISSLAYGIDSTGVEYDQELCEFSSANLDHLSKLCTPHKSGYIIEGDFTEDSTYSSKGMTFDTFFTVFNYINNESSIAHKIAQSSRPGTKFVLLGAFPIKHYYQLTLEKNLHLTRDEKNPDKILISDQPLSEDTWIDPFGTYLQVYRR